MSALPPRPCARSTTSSPGPWTKPSAGASAATTRPSWPTCRRSGRPRFGRPPRRRGRRHRARRPRARRLPPPVGLGRRPAGRGIGLPVDQRRPRRRRAGHRQGLGREGRPDPHREGHQDPPGSAHRPRRLHGRRPPRLAGRAREPGRDRPNRPPQGRASFFGPHRRRLGAVATLPLDQCVAAPAGEGRDRSDRPPPRPPPLCRHPPPGRRRHRQDRQRPPRPHARPATTLNVYAHFIPASDRLAADTLGHILSGGPPAALPRVRVRRMQTRWMTFLRRSPTERPAEAQRRTAWPRSGRASA